MLSNLVKSLTTASLYAVTAASKSALAFCNCCKVAFVSFATVSAAAIAWLSLVPEPTTVSPTVLPSVLPAFAVAFAVVMLASKSVLATEIALFPPYVL
ncbi:hypothetical protein GCM10007425_03910 [Lysinibacillus alkalisoli]|uniref:Uncharacterized protein n=1 Tax=Lysinibacillus alkalisoli TaxID=1911548 RepID=A0A917D8H9_9BACI|nr:hypothetical protein [Lysinibacillus alkalisoli]GGG12772.1 hypothetical protein GCM10007425_03910 [Lysinibacillus alkalisoli]